MLCRMHAARYFYKVCPGAACHGHRAQAAPAGQLSDVEVGEAAAGYAATAGQTSTAKELGT